MRFCDTQNFFCLLTSYALKKHLDNLGFLCYVEYNYSELYPESRKDSDVVDALTEIFKPVQEPANLICRRDYRRITPVYRCTATEEEESQCTGFLAGQGGKCCYALTSTGLKACGLVEFSVG